MAFVIKNIIGSGVENVATKLRFAFSNSRFTARIETPRNKVTIHDVRLINKKDYCGNHPFACPVRPYQPHKPHKHTKHLEGADWVAFNDMINDVLDAMNVSANVASSLCIIRKGEKRRVEYDGHKLGNGIDSEWNRDSMEYEDRRGKVSARSEYPQGTPGIPEYLLSKEEPTLSILIASHEH